MPNTNPELKVIEARQMLARTGEAMLPRNVYEQYLKDGVLEQPVRIAGRAPRHTEAQIRRCLFALERRAAPIVRSREDEQPQAATTTTRRRRLTVDQKLDRVFGRM